jgi:hypothetical protein
MLKFNSLSGENIDFVLRIFHTLCHCDVQTEQMENGDTEDLQSDEGTESGGDYGYLLSMTLWSLTKEKKDELLKKRDDKLAELKILQGRSPSSLWKEDLDMFLEQVSLIKLSFSLKSLSWPYSFNDCLVISCIAVTCIWESLVLLLPTYENHLSYHYLHLEIRSVNIT